MRSFLSALWLVAVVLLSGCGDERMLSPGSEAGTPERIARDVAAVAGWDLLPGESSGDATSSVFGFVREPVLDDIVHYSVLVPVGTGPFDVIGLHRVVRETAPFVPVRAKRVAFLVHGDAADFAGNYLAIAGTPPDRALAVLLAQSDIDVWGLDFGWSTIPEGITDFGFLEGWGIGRDMSDLATAISVARLTRQITQGGNQKVLLLGYSGGGQTSWAYLNSEAALPSGKRQVEGFVSLDSDPIATDSPEHRATTCADAAAYQALLDAGVYQDEFGLFFSTAAVLAQSAPADPSPLIEGFDNLQTALFLGAATWNLVAYTPYIHFAGGIFTDGFPTGLRYSSLDTYLEFTKALKPYFPAEIFRDRYAIQCGESAVPWNDHLGAISVPIFAVGAGGAIGEYSFYGPYATASRDVSTLLVDQDADRSLDYGHLDLMTGIDAPTLVWTPIRDWMLAH